MYVFPMVDTICMLLLMLIASSSAMELDCKQNSSCKHIKRHQISIMITNEFRVHGNRIGFTLHNTGTATTKFNIHCYDSFGILESEDLPCAKTRIRVDIVSLAGCSLPEKRSIYDTLVALNVTFKCNSLNVPCGNLTLYQMMREPFLSAEHFHGLEKLVSLEINTDDARLSSKSGFLTPLRVLRKLELSGLPLPPGELNNLPPTLRIIDMRYAVDDVNAAGPLPMTSSLERLRLFNWNELKPAPLKHCESLRELSLNELAVIALPDNWLAACSSLQKLFIYHANLNSLPPKLLFGTNKLQELALVTTQLKNLSSELLKYSPNLNLLCLRDNRLQTLPSDMFEVALRVQHLDITYNDLQGSVMEALTPLKDLNIVDFRANPRLGNLCRKDGYSSMRKSHNLSKLRLFNTSVTHICRDWREDMPRLVRLELGHTKVSNLSFQDLLFRQPVVLNFIGTPVNIQELTREDYINATSGLTSNVILQIDKPPEFECSCRTYWTRRALDIRPRIFRNINELRCKNNQLLHDIPLRNMVCKQSEECMKAKLPDTCSCDVRPDDDPTKEILLVGTHCENANLTNVPRLPNTTDRVYELFLAYNNISDLRTNDLQSNIKGLDLRYNPLKAGDTATAMRLGNVSGMLRLAGNQFNCSCDTLPLVQALRSRDLTVTDVDDANCRDGRKLMNIIDMDCLDSPPSTWVSIGLGVVIVLMVVSAMFLWSRERRFFARAVLHHYGWKWRFDSEENDECIFDAFVIFSHKDERRAREMIERLEPTYTLCVHSRDWVPGMLIAEQVVQSVSDSRRTVALVSQNFLASAWALAEFRQAHAAAMLDDRPRLIVVLLEEPEELQTDEQLQRYIMTHTYLRWTDPWFWDKLAVVLPKPSTRNSPHDHSDHSFAVEMENLCERANIDTDDPNT